jgi:hypothetical protein
MTKWFVYGIHLGPWELKASNPAQFHRGWPGFGFTHSLTFGLLIGLVIWKGFGSKLWAVSFVIGHWAHALTDTGDTVGTMLLFPWTFHFHRCLGLRGPELAPPTPPRTGGLAARGRPSDRLGYSWRVITSEYFDNIIYRAEVLALGQLLAVWGAAHAVPGGVLLWHLTLDRMDDLGARRGTPLPVRPQPGRSALGAGRNIPSCVTICP